MYSYDRRGVLLEKDIQKPKTAWIVYGIGISIFISIVYVLL